MQKKNYVQEILDIIHSGLPQAELAEKLSDYHENDLADALTALTPEERQKVYTALGVDTVAEIFSYLDDAEPYLKELDPERAARVISHMDSDDAVDALDDLEEDDKAKIVHQLDKDAADDVKLLLSYHEDEIGSCMTTNYIYIRKDMTIRQAMSELVKQAGENDNISVLYVVDENEHFYGAIDLKDLIIARAEDPLAELIVGSYPYVTDREWGKQGDADKRVQAYCYRMTLTNDPDNRISIQKPKNYNPLWYEIYARMLKLEPETKLQQIITLTPMPNKKTDTNHLDFFGASYNYAEADYKTRQEIEQLHKDYALGMLWFLGHDKRVPEHIRKEMLDWGLPKDEFTDTQNFPYQIYVREARRMIGAFVMTEKNVRKTDRTPVEHSVGLGSYALDCHYVSRVIDQEGKLRNEGTIFAPTIPYSISYYSLTPKEEECANLLATVCLSSSHVAYSTIRMEPVYMILGQSAATAAALAIDSNLPVQKISYDVLKYKLLQDGQLLSVPTKK